MAEVVAYAKANPGKMSWGSQGFGTAPHLLAELFKLETGVDIVHVPYRGTAPMLAAVLAGGSADRRRSEHDHPAAGPGREGATARGHLRPRASPSCRTCRPLQRRASRNCGGRFWLGVVAPAGTPDEIINKLNAAFRDSLAPAETRARLDNLGAEIKVGTPQAFGKMLAEELALWTEVVKAANIKVE